MIVFNCTFGGQAPEEFCPYLRKFDEIWQFIGLLILSAYLCLVACSICRCFFIEFTELLPNPEEIPQINPPVAILQNQPFQTILRSG